MSLLQRSWAKDLLEISGLQAAPTGDLTARVTQSDDGDGVVPQAQPLVEDAEARLARENEEKAKAEAEAERLRKEEEEARQKAEAERLRKEAFALFQKNRAALEVLYQTARDAASPGQITMLSDLENLAAQQAGSDKFDLAAQSLGELEKAAKLTWQAAESEYREAQAKLNDEYQTACTAAVDPTPLGIAMDIAEQCAADRKLRDAINKRLALSELCRKTTQEARAAFEKAQKDAAPAYQTALVVAGDEDKPALTKLFEEGTKLADEFAYSKAAAKFLALEGESKEVVKREGNWRGLLTETRELVLQCLRSENVDPTRAQSVFVSQLSNATALYEKGKVDDAKAVMADLKSKAELALKTPRDADAVNEAPDAKEARLKKEAEDRRDAKKRESEMVLLGLPHDVDVKPLSDLMAEHFVEAPKEALAFKGYASIDDVLALKDPAEKKKVLLGINDAMTAAVGRYKTFGVELAKLPKLSNEQRLADPKLAEAVDRARRMIGEMLSHIPDGWAATWSPNFTDRIATLTATDDEKGKIRDAAKQELTDKVKGDHVKAFRDVIEVRSASKLERYDFYFDQLVKPIAGGESYTEEPVPSHFEDEAEYRKAKAAYDRDRVANEQKKAEVEREQAELRKLYEIQDALIKTANRIRDAGGTLDEVKQAIQHVPETFWPPQFVETLQAWRKVERERLAQEVRDRFKGEQGLNKTETASDCLSLVATALGETNAWMKDEKVVTYVTTFVKEAKSIWGSGKEVGEALRQGDLSLAPGVDYDKLHDGILDSVNTLVGTVTALDKVVPGIPEKGMFTAKIVPGLALAAAGIDLYLAIKTLAQHSMTTHRSRKMKGEAEQDWAKGRDEDGGAFVRAMKNELVARAQQLTKDSLGVATAGIEVAGAGLEIGGITGVAGLTLKITGKVISYGGKVVFTNIDWAHANRAKGLIEEARAGNPVARLQIMEDCALYAKLYIAVLAREGHRLATQFIVQRGLEETDLTQAMSMKILSDALMKDAGQRDETGVADSLLEANAQGLLGAGVVKGAMALGAKARDLVSNNDTGIVYDPAWTHKPAHVVSDDRASWDAAKKEAIAAGLANQLSGVGRAMDAVKSARAALASAGPGEKKARSLEVRDALDALQDALLTYSPATCPQGEKKAIVPHKGMILYVLAVKSKVSQDRALAEKALVDGGFKDPAAVLITDSNLDAAQWKRNWAIAVGKACLPQKDDLGVAAALEKLGPGADYAKLAAIPDKQAQRKARLAYRENALALIKAINGLWSHCAECQALRDYLDRLRMKAATNAKDLDTALFLAPWQMPAMNNPLDARQWRVIWQDATTAGVADKGAGDANLASALADAEQKNAVLRQAEAGADAAKKLAARRDLTRSYAAVFVAANQFVGAQKDAVEVLKLHAVAIGRAATAQIGQLKDTCAKVTFAPVAGFTQAAWTSTNDNAIQAGALANDPRSSDLTKAFAAYEKANTAFVAEADSRKKRVLAVQAQDALNAINRAVTLLLAGDYGDHQTMSKHLVDYQGLVTTELGKPPLKGWLDGSLAPAFAVPAPFDWTDANWQAVKKLAIASGVIPDKATGFGASLTKATKSYAAWTGADPSEKAARRKLAEVDIAAAKAIARKLKGATAHPTFGGYLDACINWAGFTFA